MHKHSFYATFTLCCGLSGSSASDFNEVNGSREKEGEIVNTGNEWGNAFANIKHEHEYSLVDVAREWETAAGRSFIRVDSVRLNLRLDNNPLWGGGFRIGLNKHGRNRGLLSLVAEKCHDRTGESLDLDVKSR